MVGDELCTAGTVLWGAGVRPSPLAAALGVPLDRGGPRHRRPRLLGARPPRGVRHRRHGVVHARQARRRRCPASARSRSSRGARSRATSWASSRASRAMPFRLLRQGLHGHDRARARRRAAADACACRGLIAWLAWVFVHLWYLVGFRNRLSVFMNWIWAYVISRHGARVDHRAAPARAVTPAVTA